MKRLKQKKNRENVTANKESSALFKMHCCRGMSPDHGLQTPREQKSVNLKYITVGRLDDDMIVPPSDGPMFILINWE